MKKNTTSCRLITNRLIVLCCLIVLSKMCNAQTQPYFDNVRTHGYTVFCAYKDNHGILWLGTSNGLTTYSQITSRRPFCYVRHNELSNIIIDIEQDALGRLWLMTQTNKYMVYDPRDNSLISDVESYLKGFGIHVYYDFRLKTDSRGRLWIHKDNRLYMRDFKRHQTRLFVLPKQAGRIIGIQTIGNNVIAVTANSIFMVGMDDMVLRFFTRTPQTIPDQYLYMYRNKRGDMWLGTYDLMYRYDAKKHRWQQYRDVKSDIRCFQPMPGDRLYVATTNSGVYVYDSDGRLERHILQAAPNTYGLGNNHINTLYFDRMRQTLWVFYHKHDFSVYSDRQQEFRDRYVISANNQYKTNDVISFCEGRNGTIWLGTEDNGAYQVAADGSDRMLDNQFMGNAVTAIISDSKGRLWAGLYRNGLVCSDGKRYFPQSSPYAIIEAPDGNLFVALNGAGIWQLNPLTGQKRQIPTDNPWIMDIVYRNGKIYGASPKYLYVIDTRTLEVKALSGTMFRNSNFGAGNKMLIVDRRGWVWLVNYKNGDDVDIYDTSRHSTFKVHGLSRYSINSIVEDKQGNVWCATDRGLVRVKVTNVDHPRFDCYCFNVNNEDASTFYNLRAAFCMSDGRLLIGTTSGFKMISASRIERTMVLADRTNPLLLASMRINDNYISPCTDYNGRAVVHSDLPYVTQLRLKYNENNIALEYRPKERVGNVGNAYYYKLEGLSSDWLQMDDYTVTLSNIPPGSYRLLILEQMAGKQQSRTFDVLQLTISPPFWRSVWAYILYVVAALFVVGGSVMYWRKRQEYQFQVREMKNEQRREARLNEMKLRFFTNISHDLRTLLSLIITPVEELLDTVKDAESVDILKLVHKNAKRLIYLVNQILDFRKLEDSDVKLNPDYGDIVGFVRGCCSSFDFYSAENNVKLTFHSDFDRLEIQFDKDKMSKIISNLLSNAFKFTPCGGSVDVSVSRQFTELRIEVADTGVGIPEGDRQRVFDRFYQGGDADIKTASSGLGLHIVKEFVELHKGHISVLANTPQGTIFRIEMPIMQPASAPATVGMPANDAAQSEQIEDHHDVTILLVEDNTDMLGYLSRLLSREYNICQATDGNMALDVLGCNDVNIVVSDVMMNGMDGLTLCRRIKDNIDTSHIPVILLTAKALEEDELRGLQMGADDYITKPFNFDILRHRIRRLIQMNQNAHERFSREADIAPSEITVTTLDEQFIQNALKVVEDNIANASFSVEMLGEALGMHRTNLYKKLTFITGKTPVQFIRLIRLKRARQLLEQSHGYVSQVAYQVGFNSPKKFAKYFKEEFGMYPSEVN